MLLKKKTKYTVRDITLYFKSNCCNKTVESKPCENSPPANSNCLFFKRKKTIINPTVDYDNVNRVHLHFKNAQADGVQLVKTTLTIGNKEIGKLSYIDQHKYFIKLIKSFTLHHKKCGNDVKYIFHFELQSNGMLHAHGIEMNGNQTIFNLHFTKLGVRNSHQKSYDEVKRYIGIEEYLNYINKENILPPFTNI